MRGIIIAGGRGSRLFPMTCAINKQLIPVYDKPMIYYPLSTLMLAGISNILVISTPEALPHFQAFLGNGSDLGISISYAEQSEPRGLAEAFIIAEDFIGEDSCALILGDNIFYGHLLSDVLQNAARQTAGATIFAHAVSDPERYGVIDFDPSGKVTKLEEKPANPTSNWAVTGLYFFDNDVVEIAKQVEPSARGELEIIDVIQDYLDRQKVQVKKLGRGYVWLDTGTEDSLMQASQFVQTLAHRQGTRICCPEEIALHMSYIDLTAFRKLAANMDESAYGTYLSRIALEYTVQ